MSIAPNDRYKQIAKNAAMLSFRMLFTIIVTLYTSRVVLQTLGVEDFGVYSVVAGFVTMLGFLNNAMSSATQRFLAFELGKPGDKDVQSVFSMSMSIHMIIALFLLLLGETIGLWFVKTQMTIPEDRLIAAELVFHLALLSFIVVVISVPYRALIIAHEKMNVFAWVSMFDVTLKLIAVLILTIFGFDKLILYGVLNFLVAIIVFLIYKVYSKFNMPQSEFKLTWDQQLFKIMLEYTGWNLWGNTAFVLSGQGVNVLLNIFFGPTVNAARAIAMEVSSGLNSFVASLQVAVNPQIIKSYAASDLKYMHNLVCYSSKYSFMVLLFLSMPVLANTDEVIFFWLGSNPDYASSFVKIIILHMLVDCISGSLMTSAQATGKVKLYQIMVSGVLLLNLPLSYVFLKKGFSPEVVMYIGVVTAFLALWVRLIIVNKLIFLPIYMFFQCVVLRVLIIGLATGFTYFYLIEYNFTLGFFVSSTVVSIVSVFYTLLFGFDKLEKKFMLTKIYSLLKIKWKV